MADLPYTFYPYLPLKEETCRQIAAGTLPDRVRDELIEQCKDAVVWLDEGPAAGARRAVERQKTKSRTLDEPEEPCLPSRSKRSQGPASRP